MPNLSPQLFRLIRKFYKTGLFQFLFHINLLLTIRVTRKFKSFRGLMRKAVYIG